MVIPLIIFLISLGLLVVLITYLKKTKSKTQTQSGIDEREKRIYTTQSKLPFELIRDNMVKLKDGTFLKVLKVNSINTQLMESEEKEMVREIWGDILNSINYNIQIYKQSRIVDIEEYLTLIEDLFSSETSKKKKEAMDIYYRFMVSLVSENSLQTKVDYLVIPYKKEKEKKTFKIEEYDELKEYRKKSETRVEPDSASAKRLEYEKARRILEERAGTLIKTLARLNIFAKELTDDELLRLYYTAYNKERANIQSMERLSPRQYTSLFVKGERLGD